MVKKASTFFLGLGIVYVALVLFLKPFNNTIDYFLEQGHKTTAIVKELDHYEKTYKTSNGDWDHTFYRVTVAFEDTKMVITRSERADRFVSHNVFSALQKGDNIQVIYLDFDKGRKEGPDILLMASVESSFFDKLTVAFKGDLTRHVVALLLLILGFWVTFIGFLLLVAKEKKDEIPHRTNSSPTP